MKSMLFITNMALALAILSTLCSGCNNPNSITPTNSIGPRETKLNAELASWEQKGNLGTAILADPEVQNLVSHARSVCRSGDTNFGNNSNIQADTEVEQAEGDMYKAMTLVATRMTGVDAHSSFK